MGPCGLCITEYAFNPVNWLKPQYRFEILMLLIRFLLQKKVVCQLWLNCNKLLSLHNTLISIASLWLPLGSNSPSDLLLIGRKPEFDLNGYLTMNVLNVIVILVILFLIAKSTVINNSRLINQIWKLNFHGCLEVKLSTLLPGNMKMGLLLLIKLLFNVLWSYDVLYKLFNVCLLITAEC